MAYEIGNRIKKFREAKRLSQKDFAEQIGVSNSRVSNWEQGVNRPDVDLLVNICKVLNVSPSELLDFRLDTDELTHHERQLIINYRRKTYLRMMNYILVLRHDVSVPKFFK